MVLNISPSACCGTRRGGFASCRSPTIAIPNFVVIPLPSPAAPWQGEQLILNRSCPRASDVAVSGIGLTSTQLVVRAILPVEKGDSSYAEPRATVPGTGSCELLWSLKNAFTVCGRSFGCLSISVHIPNGVT